MKKKTAIIVIVSVAVALLAAALIIWFCLKKKKVEHTGLNQRKFAVEVKEEQDKLAHIRDTIHIDIHRFDQELMRLDTANVNQAMQTLKGKYPIIAWLYPDMFLDSGNEFYPQYLSQMRGLLKDPYYSQLFKEVNSVFGDMSDIRTELKNALALYIYYFPDAQIPQFYTVALGIDPEDSRKLVYSIPSENGLNVMIHLDWYLGEKSQFYSGNGLPVYLRSQLKKENLPIHCFRNAIVWEQLPNREPITLLDNMIDQGKVYYFTEVLFYNRPVKDIFGYTDAQMKWAEQNHGKVWDYIKEKEWLFSKDAQVAQHLTGIAPFTSPFKDSPGQMGSFIGWKIVASYMENHPETSISDLMKMTNSNELLNKSGYKPRVDKDLQKK